MSKRFHFAILSVLALIAVNLSWTNSKVSNLVQLYTTSSRLAKTTKDKIAPTESNGKLNGISNDDQHSSELFSQGIQATSVDDTYPMTTRRPTVELGENRNISILVQLSGELGNNLAKISHGICLQEWLQEEFNTASTIILRHQLHPKWIRGYQNAIRCFPYTRQFDFEAGNSPSIDAWLKGPVFPEWWERMMSLNQEHAETAIRQGLQSIVDLWRKNQANASFSLTNVTTVAGTSLSSPFLFANKFADLHVCMDKYYDTIRARLEFDARECCNQVPFANETVFVCEHENESHLLTRYLLHFSKALDHS